MAVLRGAQEMSGQKTLMVECHSDELAPSVGISLAVRSFAVNIQKCPLTGVERESLYVGGCGCEAEVSVRVPRLMDWKRPSKFFASVPNSACSLFWHRVTYVSTDLIASIVDFLGYGRIYVCPSPKPVFGQMREIC
jgi:hypothetical protein